MTVQKPFLFDRRNFDAEVTHRELPPEQQLRYNQRDFDQAVEAAEARGQQAGFQQAEAQREQQIADALKKIVQQFELFLPEQAARDAAAQELAVNVALTLVRKLVPELLNQPLSESITQFVKEILAAHYDEAKLIIRVHESMMDDLHQRMQTLPELQRVQDKYALMADPQLAPSDCRVEWPSGGMERHTSRLWQQLESVTTQLAERLRSGTVGEAASEGAGYGG